MLLACLLTVAWHAEPAAAQTQTGQFLVITDIHFNPFADPTLFDDLHSRPASAWPRIFAGGKQQAFSGYGQDANYQLMESCLDDAAARIPQPDFVLYPGDFLGHYWQRDYDRLAKQDRHQDPAAYRAFTDKAMAMMTAEFDRRFPRAPIYATLGNTDAYCEDYQIEPQGGFLDHFARSWAPLLREESAVTEFRRSFPNWGNYSVPLAAVPKHRLISLNNLFFSPSYDNACGNITHTPALDLLGWLADELASARDRGERVWLLTHVPPGLDTFATAKSRAAGGAPVTFWQSAVMARFLQLVSQYRETLAMCFVGHSHMDDYRVIQLQGENLLLSKIVPSVSPLFANNPAYQVYQYDRATGQILNFQTYYLTNLAELSKPNHEATADWALEYDFRKAYGLDRVTAESIATMSDQLRGETLAASHYRRYYSSSAGAGIDARQLDVYRCAIISATPGMFDRCCDQK